MTLRLLFQDLQRFEFSAILRRRGNLFRGVYEQKDDFRPQMLLQTPEKRAVPEEQRRRSGAMFGRTKKETGDEEWSLRK